MTEEEARDWVRTTFGVASYRRFEQFAALLTTEAARQNLVARSSLEAIWSRHLADSAQLALLAEGDGLWLDIGTGGGMPGMVLALLLDRRFVLCEPRRLRVSFLQSCVDTFALGARVSVRTAPVEKLDITAATISARAVAAIDALITAARHCAGPATIWLLPRGQSGAEEIERSVMLGQGVFHVKQSLTDPRALIVVASRLAGA